MRIRWWRRWCGWGSDATVAALGSSLCAAKSTAQTSTTTSRRTSAATRAGATASTRTGATVRRRTMCNNCFCTTALNIFSAFRCDEPPPTIIKKISSSYSGGFIHQTATDAFHNTSLVGSAFSCKMQKKCGTISGGGAFKFTYFRYSSFKIRITRKQLSDFLRCCTDLTLCYFSYHFQNKSFSICIFLWAKACLTCIESSIRMCRRPHRKGQFFQW